MESPARRPSGVVERAPRVIALATAALVAASLAGCGRAAAPVRGSQPAVQSGADRSPAVLNEGPEQGRVPGGPERCFNARDDDGNGLVDDGCGVPAGLVQFVIAWDAPTADVDLLVTDPLGELSDVGRPTSTGLVKERDCPGRHAECQGKNFENVYVEREDARRGTYKVSVVLERLEDEDVPIRVTLGARVGGRSFEKTLSLTRLEEKVDFAFTL